MNTWLIIAIGCLFLSALISLYYFEVAVQQEKENKKLKGQVKQLEEMLWGDQ